MFWPVRQSGAAVEHKLSLSQNKPISCYTYMYISWCVNWETFGYVNKQHAAREWRGEENFSLLYRARLLLLNSRIWGFLHLLLESRFLSLSLTLFLSFCQKNCVLRVWRSVLWRCYQFRFFWPMVIFWQTILLRFYALLLFWNYDRIMMTEKTHK